jgi:hypothetical protein
VKAVDQVCAAHEPSISSASYYTSDQIPVLAIDLQGSASQSPSIFSSKYLHHTRGLGAQTTTNVKTKYVHSRCFQHSEKNLAFYFLTIPTLFHIHGMKFPLSYSSPIKFPQEFSHVEMCMPN